MLKKVGMTVGALSIFLSLGVVTNNAYAETNELSLTEQEIQLESERIEKQLNQDIQELYKIYPKEKFEQTKLQEKDVDQLLSYIKEDVVNSTKTNEDKTIQVLEKAFQISEEQGNNSKVLRGYSYPKLTSQELYLVGKYPSEAVVVNETKQWALTMSKQMYPNDGGLWDHQDAFRHAHWNEQMANRIGQNLASQFATAHESTSSGNDKAMDLHNNAVGRAHPGEGHDKLRQLAKWGYFRVFDGNGNLTPTWY